MAADAPRDKLRAVWLAFFVLGLGTLLPWNFFMTATAYFTGRLRESSNGTAAVGAEPERSVLEAKFNNVMTLCAMTPLLVFTCLNSFLYARVPEGARVAGSLALILAVFLLTAVLVKVRLEPAAFFAVTALSVVVINSFGAVLQGSLFGMAGALPAAYTAPIMSGQGLAGTFAALAMICAIASGSSVEEASFGYFISACVVILVSILAYAALPKLEFFRFYRRRKDEHKDDVAVNLTRPASAGEGPLGTSGVSVATVFKKIRVLAACVCATFTITIGTFPAVAADTKSTLARGGGAWGELPPPVRPRVLCAGGLLPALQRQRLGWAEPDRLLHLAWKGQPAASRAGGGPRGADPRLDVVQRAAAPSPARRLPARRLLRRLHAGLRLHQRLPGQPGHVLRTQEGSSSRGGARRLHYGVLPVAGSGFGRGALFRLPSSGLSRRRPLTLDAAKTRPGPKTAEGAASGFATSNHGEGVTVEVARCSSTTLPC